MERPKVYKILYCYINSIINKFNKEYYKYLKVHQILNTYDR